MVVAVALERKCASTVVRTFLARESALAVSVLICGEEFAPSSSRDALLVLSLDPLFLLLLVVFLFFSRRTSSFSGFVVAKLPFVPFSLLQKLSHRNLAGDDPTDCSVVS